MDILLNQNEAEKSIKILKILFKDNSTMKWQQNRHNYYGNCSYGFPMVFRWFLYLA